MNKIPFYKVLQFAGANPSFLVQVYVNTQILYFFLLVGLSCCFSIFELSQAVFPPQLAELILLVRF